MTTTTLSAAPATRTRSSPAPVSTEIREFHVAVKQGLPKGVTLRNGVITLWANATCSPLRVKAFVLGEKRTDWTSIVEFIDSDGRLVECEVPWRILHGKPRDAIALLADLGFCMSTDKIAGQVLDLIRSWPVPEDARQVGLQNFGWTRDRDAFAFPDGSVLSRGNGATVYRVPGEISARAIGTLEAWKDGVGALSKGNPYLLFAISAAFAAPLMSFTTLNTPIFHFYTDSESFTVALDEAISKASGPAGIAFVREIFQNSDTDIQKYVNTQLKIEKQSLLDALELSDQTAVPGEVHRVLNAFALVSVAGELATKFGVTGWES